jgi:ubiquinone/menaquinone biosynthesis C-methylase UbiE
MSEPRAVDPAVPESYAGEWRRQAGVRADSLAGATELLLDMAGVSEGMRVLDLGAGLGDQSITAARRVGPSGFVLATDRDPAMVEGAREAAAKAGLTNVQTRVMDAQAIEVEPGSFDVVISR